jgi:PKHD-type hydroxylase
MLLKNYYWYFESALPARICDDIINLGKQKEERLALTGDISKKDNGKITKKDIKNLKKRRDSNVAFLDDKWVYNQIHPFIHAANEASGWNFDWDWSEPCQFTKYKLNQYYDWHCDSWDTPYDNPKNINFHNKIRKLSVTVSLSEPTDYKGGELEFDCRNEDPTKGKKKNILTCNEIKPRGSIVVFPSHVWHRVKPVTKGVRYSLVIWNLGYPFK